MRRLFALLVIPALAILAACDGGHPVGQQPGNAKSAVGTQSAVPTGQAGSVRIGAENKVFSTPLPASSAQAKVVEDFRESQILWDESDTAWRLVAPVGEYVTGPALLQLQDAVAASRQQGIVPAGTDRMFSTAVTALGFRNATVTTCDDGSRFEEQYRQTGQIDKQFRAAPNQQYMFLTWRMVKLAGHWAVNSLTIAQLPTPAAQRCQP